VFSGSSPSCMKTYKSLGWAKRRAKKSKAKVVLLPDTKKWFFSAKGTIKEEIPSTPGYVKFITLDIKDFIVE